MNENKNSVVLYLINYIFLVVFLALGGFLFLKYPANQAIDGIVLSLAGIIFGIIMPYHLKKIKAAEYRFFPAKKDALKAIIGAIIFTAILVFIYPSGILGDKAIITVFNYPPALLPALLTFLFLLFSATSYALLFWGGMLSAFKKAYGNIIAVLVTSFLFSLYHVAEFAVTSITFDFLLLMFISAIMCTVFTLLMRSVLPTLIAQQFGQFVYFISLENNPLSGPAGVIMSYVLLLICFGVYKMLAKRSEWIRA